MIKDRTAEAITTNNTKPITPEYPKKRKAWDPSRMITTANIGEMRRKNAKAAKKGRAK